MGLPRTFVGFSSTDIRSYWLMLAWKANDHIDFTVIMTDYIFSAYQSFFIKTLR